MLWNLVIQQQQFWMKECDIFRGSKHTLTNPTYFQGSCPHPQDLRPSATLTRSSVKFCVSARGALTQSEIPKIPNRYRDIFEIPTTNTELTWKNTDRYTEKPIPTWRRRRRSVPTHEFPERISGISNLSHTRSWCFHAMRDEVCEMCAILSSNILCLLLTALYRVIELRNPRKMEALIVCRWVDQ